MTKCWVWGTGSTTMTYLHVCVEGMCVWRVHVCGGYKCAYVCVQVHVCAVSKGLTEFAWRNRHAIQVNSFTWEMSYCSMSNFMNKISDSWTIKYFFSWPVSMSIYANLTSWAEVKIFEVIWYLWNIKCLRSNCSNRFSMNVHLHKLMNSRKKTPK